jgi:hypothetical protein
MKRKLIFQLPFMFITETIMQLLVPCFLWIERQTLTKEYGLNEDISSTDKFQAIFTICLLVLCLIVFLSYFGLISFFNLEKIQSKWFKEYFGYNLKRIQDENRIQLFYNFWFILRRVIVCIDALFIKRAPGL